MIYDKNESGIYFSSRYLTKERWFSFWQQIDEVKRNNPESILEIGAGGNIVKFVLDKIGYNVKTLDFDPANKPDFLGDITQMDLSSLPKFDLVMACQIFEHVRYEDFLDTLDKMKTIVQKHLIISLPFATKGSIKFYFSLMFLPILPRLVFAKIFNLFPCRWQYAGVHFWELGTRGFSLRKVLKDIRATGWRVLRHYPVKENTYHYFIVLEKADLHV